LNLHIPLFIAIGNLLDSLPIRGILFVEHFSHLDGLAMLTEHILTVGNDSLHYARGPSSGPPMLFLHGVLRCWQDFLPLIAPLTVRWHVHALDFRGHGKSSPRPGRYRVVDYVEDAAAFLRHGCDEPAVVYGHSLGAMVALAVAGGPHAECVRALVLEDPPFGTVGPGIHNTVFVSQFRGLQQFAGSTQSVAEIARGMAEIRLVSPGTGRVIRFGDVRDAISLRFSARCLRRVDPEVFEPLIAGQWLDGYNLDAILSGIRCPVLLLQGDMAAGGMMADEDAALLESRLPDCARVKLEGVGHLIHWTQIETTLRLLAAYLESLDRDE
jgi:pimeloyl-ACP methyl ester carboxylesterase